MKKYLLLFLAGCTSLLMSCTQDEDVQFNEDLKLIEQYLAANPIEGKQKDEDGLHYLIRNPGNPDGRQPLDTSNVSLGYEGRLLNNQVFDRRDTITFRLNQLVRGFSLGAQKVKEGGDIMVIMPSRLGYGGQARQGIPSNSILIFDIKVHKVL